jgi:hypothetical protein
MLAKRGVPLEAVVTKLRFDPEEATPKIQFSPEGFLDEAQFAEAREIAGTELVENILGTAYVPEVEGDEPPAEQKAEAPKAPKPTPKPKVEISDEKTVTPDEVKAAVDAGKKGEPVVEAKKVAKEEPQEEAAETAEAAGAIEVDGIPDLSKISFDD